MKARYSLFRRGRVYYWQDSLTGKQASLRTRDADEARTLVNARNEATRQPFLNLRIAQTYLAASDEKIAKRTWQNVMEEFTLTKSAANRPQKDRFPPTTTSAATTTSRWG